MSERYSRLFALPADIYAEGAPVVIAAGALLKDNQTGKTIAQIKLHSISDEVIIAVKAAVTPRDVKGAPLGGAVEQQYLDRRVQRDDEFGQKVPVKLPDDSARSFGAEVLEVVFEGGGVWTASGQPWEPLGEPVPLEDALGAGELTKQFRIEHGFDCRFAYAEERGLWRCPCGELNRLGEDKCRRCGKERAAVSEPDMDALRAACDERLAAEQKKAAENRAAAEARAKKAKKIAVVAVPLLIIAVVAGVFISNGMKNSAAYDEAVALMESHSYDDAAAASAALGDYKDSAAQIDNVWYSKACYLVECAETGSREPLDIFEELDLSSEDTIAAVYYREALGIFEELGDYKDSAAQAESIQAWFTETEYQTMLSLLDSEDFTGAINTLGQLGDYKDCPEILAELQREGGIMQELYECLSLEEPEVGVYNQVFPDRAAVLLDELYAGSDTIYYKSAAEAYQDFVDGYLPFCGEFEVVAVSEGADDTVTYFDAAEGSAYTLTTWINPDFDSEGGFPFGLDIRYTKADGSESMSLSYFDAFYGSTDFYLTIYISADFHAYLNDAGNVVLEAYNNDGLDQWLELRKVS